MISMTIVGCRLDSQRTGSEPMVAKRKTHHPPFRLFVTPAWWIGGDGSGCGSGEEDDIPMLSIEVIREFATMLSLPTWLTTVRRREKSARQPAIGKKIPPPMFSLRIPASTPSHGRVSAHALLQF